MKFSTSTRVSTAIVMVGLVLLMLWIAGRLVWHIGQTLGLV